MTLFSIFIDSIEGCRREHCLGETSPGASASVPDAPSLGLDERDATLKRGRVAEQKPIGEIVKVVLVKGGETVCLRLIRGSVQA
jgi:hypothetical protein